MRPVLGVVFPDERPEAFLHLTSRACGGITVVAHHVDHREAPHLLGMKNAQPLGHAAADVTGNDVHARMTPCLHEAGENGHLTTYGGIHIGVRRAFGETVSEQVEHVCLISRVNQSGNHVAPDRRGRRSAMHQNHRLPGPANAMGNSISSRGGRVRRLRVVNPGLPWTEARPRSRGLRPGDRGGL